MVESPKNQEASGVDSKGILASRRKRLIVATAILIVVLGVALGVGLGVGLSRKNSESDEDKGNSDSNTSNGTEPTSRNALWQPAVGATWQIVLLKPIWVPENSAPVPDVGIYDIDLFDNNASTIAALRTAGKRVICYFSAGSWEDWRPDKAAFAADALGKELSGWQGERWVNVSAPSVRDVMRERIKLAASKGCDAIDPDNVDGFQNDNGLGLTKTDAVDFVEFLAGEALLYNMTTGLKNAGDIIPDVLSSVHFSVNEQCVEKAECETFAAFITAGKPVFNIEYPEGAPTVSKSSVDEICSNKDKAVGSDNFSTVIKKMDLDGWVEFCDGNTYTTDIMSRK